MPNIVPTMFPHGSIDFAPDEVGAPLRYARLGEGSITGGFQTESKDYSLLVHTSGLPAGTFVLMYQQEHVAAVTASVMKPSRIKGLLAKLSFGTKSAEDPRLGEISSAVDSFAKIISLELQHAVQRDPEVRKAVNHFTTRAKSSQAQGLMDGLIKVIKMAGSIDREMHSLVDLQDHLFIQKAYQIEPRRSAKVLRGSASVSPAVIDHGAQETNQIGGESTQGEAKADPLAGARLRGQRYKIDVLDSEEILTPSKVCEIFAVSAARVSQMRKERKIFAVRHPLKPRSLGYPRWQLEERVFDVLGDILPLFDDDDGWRIWLFLTSVDPVLRDFTPLEVLRGKAEEAEDQTRLDALLATSSSRELVQRAAKAYVHGGE